MIHITDAEILQWLHESQGVASLREQVWLLAHDEHHHLRPRVDARVLEIGLVAATLTDLLLRNRIYVHRGLIYTNLKRPTPVADPIAAHVQSAIGQGPPPHVADVIRGACGDLPNNEQNPYQRLSERTLGGLIAGGHVREQRRWLRRTRYQLADPTVVSSIRAVLRHRLVRHPRSRQRDPAVDCLCALVLALDLHHTMVLPVSTDEAERVLLYITAAIPASAGHVGPLTTIPQLVQIVRDAVGDHRRSDPGSPA
jgi:hypothetical protein